MIRGVVKRVFVGALLSTTMLAGEAASTPLYRNWDENGVDLVRGDYQFDFVEGSIGSGKAALPLIRVDNSLEPSQWDRIRYRFSTSGGVTTKTVTLPDGSEERWVGGVNVKENGATLTTNAAGETVYVSRQGTRITFYAPTLGQTEYRPKSMINAGDFHFTFTHTTSGSGASQQWRLASISNSFGYSIAFSYQSNTPGTTAWKTRTGAQLKRDTLVPMTVGYAYPSAGMTDVTDSAGKVWRITGTSIKRPDESSAGFVVSASGGIVTSVTNDGVITNYGRSVAGNTVTLTRTDALANATVITSDLAIDRVTSVRDPLTRTTTYEYDASTRLKKVTAPEGNAVEYVLDPRGNREETRYHPKPGSTEPTLTWITTFASTCADPLTCNKGTAVLNPNGKKTDYEY